MQIKELYNKLLEAYSDKNLNQITGKLIELYKGKNYSKIREIANKISKFVSIDEEKDAKCFSKLIVLYHPDKGEASRTLIKRYYFENDPESLTKFSHILLLKDIENIPVSIIDESIDYNPEYSMEEPENEGYYFYDENEKNTQDTTNIEDYERSFYNAVKFRLYGDLTIEFPPHYLEDFEDFEMVESGIETLDGIEFCVHALTFDLSNNYLTDISEIGTLKRIEELYLANNEIGYIDAISNLLNLRIVDLSGNQIDDLSPLFKLDNLEYVNVIDNPVPNKHIEKLLKKGIIVMH